MAFKWKRIICPFCGMMARGVYDDCHILVLCGVCGAEKKMLFLSYRPAWRGEYIGKRYEFLVL